MKTEEQIAAAVVARLTREGYICHAEVEQRPGDPRPDIVGVGPAGTLWVVECKRSLTLALVEQIEGWRQHAPLRSVAVGARESGKATVSRVLSGLGVGLFVVEGDDCIQVTAPRRRDRAPLAQQLLESLRPEQQTYAPAGNAEGRRWTPQQTTEARLGELVAAEPGLTLAAAIRRLGHHYPTTNAARADLRWRLAKGLIDGVRLERTKARARRVVLMPAERTF